MWVIFTEPLFLRRPHKPKFFLRLPVLAASLQKPGEIMPCEQGVWMYIPQVGDTFPQHALKQSVRCLEVSSRLQNLSEVVARGQRIRMMFSQLLLALDQHLAQHLLSVVVATFRQQGQRQV